MQYIDIRYQLYCIVQYIAVFNILLHPYAEPLCSFKYEPPIRDATIYKFYVICHGHLRVSSHDKNNLLVSQHLCKYFD